jgi:hypothetical protein
MIFFAQARMWTLILPLPRSNTANVAGTVLAYQTSTARSAQALDGAPIT